MADFQTRIEDIIGPIPSLASDNSSAIQQAITDALVDTSIDIINKVNPDILIQYATKSSNVTSNPIASDVENSKVLLVERRGEKDLYVSCVYVTPDLAGKIQNTDSIFYPSSEMPNWTWNDNDLYVYPEPNASNPSRYYIMNNPTVAYDSTTVAKFPNELEHALIVGASARLKQRFISFFNEDEDPELVQLHRAQWAEISQLYQDLLSPYMVSS